MCFAGEGELELEASRHFPEFGVERQSLALCFTSRGAGVESGYCIANAANTLEYDLSSGALVDGVRCSG